MCNEWKHDHLKGACTILSSCETHICKYMQKNLLTFYFNVHVQIIKKKKLFLDAIVMGMWFLSDKNMQLLSRRIRLCCNYLEISFKYIHTRLETRTECTFRYRCEREKWYTYSNLTQQGKRTPRGEHMDKRKAGTTKLEYTRHMANVFKHDNNHNVSIIPEDEALYSPLRVYEAAFIRTL